MASDIAYFQVSTEEDLRLEIDFSVTFDLTGKTLRVEIRERASAALKTTLTIGAGLTVALPGKVVAYVAKASMAGWARGEYTADLIDTSSSMQRRIVPVRFMYDEPGNLPGGVRGNSATVSVGNSQAIITAVRGETGQQGVVGPANSLTIGTVTNLPPGSTPSAEITGTAPSQVLNLSVVRGIDGIGGPTDQGYQALLRQMELEAALARLATPVTELPSLNLDFLFDTYFARKAAISASLPAFISAMAGSFTRASAAWYFDATGTLVQAANNVPRLDHDPVTRARLGYLAEGARTNSIRNNTMVGAVVGSPGTLPTNWLSTGSGNGLSREVVGFGAINGINYIDIRFSGTAVSAGTVQLSPDAVTGIAAAVGQTWAGSLFWQLIAGSFVNTNYGNLQLYGLASNGAWLESSPGTPMYPNASSLNTQRPTLTYTLANVGSNFVSLTATFGYSAGAVIDFTIRIGLPQLELGAYATSAIKTTGAAVTRAADLLTLPAAPWYSASGITILARGRIDRVTGDSLCLAEIGDGTYSSRIIHQISASTGIDSVNAFAGGSNGQIVAASIPAAGAVRISAHAVGPGSRAVSFNGAAVGTSAAPASVPLATNLWLGRYGPDNTGSLNGHIQRLVVIPGRLTNAQVQALSGATL